MEIAKSQGGLPAGRNLAGIGSSIQCTRCATIWGLSLGGKGDQLIAPGWKEHLVQTLRKQQVPLPKDREGIKPKLSWGCHCQILTAISRIKGKAQSREFPYFKVESIFIGVDSAKLDLFETVNVLEGLIEVESPASSMIHNSRFCQSLQFRFQTAKPRAAFFLLFRFKNDSWRAWCQFNTSYGKCPDHKTEKSTRPVRLKKRKPGHSGRRQEHDFSLQCFLSLTWVSWIWAGLTRKAMAKASPVNGRSEQMLTRTSPILPKKRTFVVNSGRLFNQLKSSMQALPAWPVRHWRLRASWLKFYISVLLWLFNQQAAEWNTRSKRNDQVPDEATNSDPLKYFVVETSILAGNEWRSPFSPMGLSVATTQTSSKTATMHSRTTPQLFKESAVSNNLDGSVEAPQDLAAQWSNSWHSTWPLRNRTAYGLLLSVTFKTLNIRTTSMY